MKRWLDALLSRWYVPREHFEASIAVNHRWEEINHQWEEMFYWAMNEVERRDAIAPTPTLVVTTDYQRGTPCS